MTHVVACATLVAAPILVFRPFPVPGPAYLAMALPLLVLVAAYLTTSGNRVPTAEMALLGLIALSLLWSEAPDYSFLRVRSFLPVALATVVAASIVSGAVVLRCLKLAIAIILGCSLIAIALDPAGALGTRGTDVLLTAQFSKNTYGGLLLVGLVLTLGTRRVANIIILPGLIVFLALNRTVTAWLVGTVIVVAYLVFTSLRRRVDRAALGPAAVAIIVATAGGAALLSAVAFDSAVAAVGKDPTLGRRTQIWSACWEQIQQAPVLGHGAYAFLDPSSDSPATRYVLAQFLGYRPPHPHNGLLDLLGQLGLVGLVLFLALVVPAALKGARAAVDGSSTALTGITGLALVIAFGVTEPTYLGAWLILIVMFVAIASPRDSTSTPPGSGLVLGRSHRSSQMSRTLPQRAGVS